MKCSKCGGNVEKNSKFCKFCGKKINPRKKNEVRGTHGFVVSVAVFLLIVALLMWGVVAYAMFSPTGYVVDDKIVSLGNSSECDMNESGECLSKKTKSPVTGFSVKGSFDLSFGFQ